jgi:hypothetical protein
MRAMDLLFTPSPLFGGLAEALLIIDGAEEVVIRRAILTP